MFFGWFKRRIDRNRTAVDHTPCPHCGAMIPETAEFCRHCGACEASGWQDESEGYVGEEADEDFDYDEFVQREFPHDAPRKPDFKTFVIIVILICFALGVLLAF